MAATNPLFIEARKRTGGIPPELIVDGIPPEVSLICSLCNNILWEAMTCLYCYKDICSLCLEKYEKGLKEEICPYCKKKSRFDAVKTQLIKEVLNSRNFHCVNANCTQELKYEELDKHFCEYDLMKCSVPDCNTNINRFEYQNHLQNCIFLQESCPHCEEKFQHRELSLHEESCPMKLVICPYNCAEGSYLRKDTQTHESLGCTRYPISCEFCKIEVPQEELIHHSQVDCPEKLDQDLRCLCKNIPVREREEHIELCESYPVLCVGGCGFEIPRRETEGHDCLQFLFQMYERLRDKSSHRKEYLNKLDIEKKNIYSEYIGTKKRKLSGIWSESMIEDMDKYVFHCNTSGCVIYGYYEGIGAKIGEKMIFKCAHCEYKYCVKNCLSPCSECRPEEDELELHHSTEILLCKGCCHSKCEHEGCRNPKKTFCTKKHRTLCSSCNKTLCQGCRRVCGKTGKVICPDCCRTCSTCKLIISTIISLSKECGSCRNELNLYLCQDSKCKYTCEECTESICHKCFTKCNYCQVCGKILCGKCRVPCFCCKLMLCKSSECMKYCMHEVHTPHPVPICNECIFCDCPRCGIICSKCKYSEQLALPSKFNLNQINLNVSAIRFTQRLMPHIERIFKAIWHNPEIRELHFGK